MSNIVALRSYRLRSLCFVAAIILVFSIDSFGQSTEFTYQGSLKDGASAATGNYDLEFRMYDAPGGGSQIGAVNSRSGVAVAAGIFSVNLDFGSGFTGSDRYLEISVKTSGGGAFTVLSPRQRIASSPYSIKSLNASNADNATSAVAATNFTGNLNGDVTGTQASTTVARLQSRNVANTAPTDGQVLKYNAATSQWRPDTDSTGNGGGGTITGVTVGTGLTGGGVTGIVAVSIANGGVATAQIADASVTDAKIVGVNGAKVTGTVANATNAATATNSTQLGGVAANQYVQTNDARLTDARSPTANSPSYIQNTSSQQAVSNFNISGNGIVGGIFNANTVKTDTSFLIGPFRALSADGTANLIAGIGAGSNNTGSNNAFFGRDAGRDNTSGLQNSFFGSFAGQNNGTGFSNSFFGSNAGQMNTANGNSFFGALAGLNNTTGGDNSFFGRSAGSSNTTATGNAFFGAFSGVSNTTGANNAFFGHLTGTDNTTGQANSFFGAGAGQSTTTGTSNTFIGRGSGAANTSGGSNTFVGIRSGEDNTNGTNIVFVGRDAGANNTTGFDNTFVGAFAGVQNATGNNNTVVGNAADLSTGNLSFATAIGASAVASLSNSIYLGRSGGQDAVRIAGATIMDGSLVIGTLGSAGSQSVCLNAANRVSPCSSSLRYKTNIHQFGLGVDLIRQLKPITFDWKDGGMHDLGLGAEDVAKIEPLLVHYNGKGEVEGIKYDRIGVVLVNAVKEQQAQIEALLKRLIILEGTSQKRPKRARPR